MSGLGDLVGDVIPRSRNDCPDCEATPASCRGVRGLRGTYCCAACDQRGGGHDDQEDR